MLEINLQGEVVHANENYKVVLGGNGYLVINKNTGVAESDEKMLPQAILHSENSNSFLKNRLWRWVAVQGVQQNDALDKEEAATALDDDSDSVVLFDSEMELDSPDSDPVDLDEGDGA